MGALNDFLLPGMRGYLMMNVQAVLSTGLLISRYILLFPNVPICCIVFSNDHDPIDAVCMLCLVIL